jgi:hypothetical protein
MPENVVVPGLPITNKMGAQDQALGSSGEEYEFNSMVFQINVFLCQLAFEAIYI